MLKATPRSSTWVIHILSVVLFFLISWLFSFVIDDLNDIDAPDHQQVLEQYVDIDLYNRRSKAKSDLKVINAAIKTTSGSLDNIKSASGGNNAPNLVRFSNELIKQELEKTELLAELKLIEREFAPQDKKYRAEWQALWDAHRFWIAVYKLAFIIPMFILASWLRSRRRDSAMKPIFTALLIAAFWHLGVIANDHFPEVVFKYIAIAVGITIVLAALVHLLRRASQPRDLDLLKLRREAYANHICSCCAFPIRRHEDSNYICPSCGTQLFGSCNSCQTTRHSLLPYCGNCGTE
jgi:predicted RNA-binding Zn-ribbon protein involved in translation (DUF1610 family)